MNAGELDEDESEETLLKARQAKDVAKVEGSALDLKTCAPDILIFVSLHSRVSLLRIE